MEGCSMALEKAGSKVDENEMLIPPSKRFRFDKPPRIPL